MQHTNVGQHWRVKQLVCAEVIVQTIENVVGEQNFRHAGRQTVLKNERASLIHRLKYKRRDDEFVLRVGWGPAYEWTVSLKNQPLVQSRLFVFAALSNLLVYNMRRRWVTVTKCCVQSWLDKKFSCMFGKLEQQLHTTMMIIGLLPVVSQSQRAKIRDVLFKLFLSMCAAHPEIYLLKNCTRARKI